jgi:RNA polymerase sigma factor (sigma-70 family)
VGQPSPKLIWIRGVLGEYEGRLIRYASRRLPVAQAKEAVQETFLKLWQEEPPPPEERLAPWLFTVCRNQVIDVLRKEGRMSQLSDQHSATLASDENGPSDVLENKQTSNIVVRCIHELPAAQQEVVRLKFQEGLSYQEISRVTGHSVSYVGVLLHQAVVRLRVRLAQAAAAEKGGAHGA